jgi:flagellar hook-length control protein FliK
VQTAPTDLADWLRLALARAVTPQAAAPTDASAAADGASSIPTEPSTRPAVPNAPDPSRAQADAAPIDLRALLGADSAAQASAQPLGSPGNAPRERVASDTSRRSAASITPAERAAQLAASDLANAGAQRAPELEAPAGAVATPIAITKSAALDDYRSLVAPPASADSTTASAPALPPLGHATTPNAATATASAASAQGALPQHLGDAVDARSTQWHDALATRIQWLVDHDVGEAKIKLNPPELGALDVKISLLDDKTFVQMTAHSASVRDELAQGLPRLRELLSAGGLELGGATVSGGHDDRGAFGSAAPQPITRAASFTAAAEALPDSPRPRFGTSAAVIDTFA